MAYDEKVVRAAKQRLEKRRRDAETSAAALKERLCNEMPRLREIEREKAGIQAEIDAIEIKLDDLWRKYRME